MITIRVEWATFRSMDSVVWTSYLLLLFRIREVLMDLRSLPTWMMARLLIWPCQARSTIRNLIWRRMYPRITGWFITDLKQPMRAIRALKRNFWVRAEATKTTKEWMQLTTVSLMFNPFLRFRVKWGSSHHRNRLLLMLPKEII